MIKKKGVVRKSTSPFQTSFRFKSPKLFFFHHMSNWLRGLLLAELRPSQPYSLLYSHLPPTIVSNQDLRSFFQFNITSFNGSLY